MKCDRANGKRLLVPKSDLQIAYLKAQQMYRVSSRSLRAGDTIQSILLKKWRKVA